MSILTDSAWKDWYKAQHECKWRTLSGTAFEDYVKSILKLADVSFIDPDPMGSLGDWGCDGITADGTTLYACYGSSSRTDSESKLVAKINSDFFRAKDQWTGFSIWQFITNSKFGPKAARRIVELQQMHAPDSERPIELRVWKEASDLWVNVISKLPIDQLNEIFPGVPHAQNVELSDMIPLLDVLQDAALDPQDNLQPIDPVAETKMDYNDIPQATRLEFNVGRSCGWRIEDWFGRQADPTLRDKKAAAFNRIYQEARKAHSEASEIVEEVYTALGGADFRLDSKRANAVYAVTACFFDSCDIFEKPPAGYDEEGES